MDNFHLEVLKPILLILFGFVIGVVKAFIRKTPLSNKEEIINFHKHLAKPVCYGFLTIFILLLIGGFFVNDNLVEVFQKALLFALYTSAAIYIFMIWGANLIREK